MGFFRQNERILNNLALSGMRKLILASTSPYRAQALQRLGLNFTAQASDVDEYALSRQSPEQHGGSETLAALALRLAHAKAAAVAAQHRDAVIIGADQIGELHGNRLGKPGSRTAAVEQLCQLSGQHAQFHSAVAVHDTVTGARQGCVVTTELEFRAFSSDAAQYYVDLDNPIDCAGSFKVEAAGIALFRRISCDDPSALVGLPMITLLDQLERCGISPLQPA
jgi:septum formation protein